MPHVAQWTARIRTVLALPVLLFATTLVLTQSQIGRLLAPTWWWSGAVWTALEWVLPTLLVWIIWRKWQPTWQWRDVGTAWGEATMLAAVSVLAGWAFGLLWVDVRVDWQGVVYALALVIPIAGWCWSEELLLRVVLARQVQAYPVWVQALGVWLAGVAVQSLLVQQWTWVSVMVVVLAEAVSCLSWYSEGRFGLLWGRRSSWRWLASVVCGFAGVGMLVSGPRPWLLVPAGLEIGGFLVATWLLTWLIQLLLQHWLHTQASDTATFSHDERHTK